MITSVALLLLVGTFLLAFVEAERASKAAELGYPGHTLRIVATADTSAMPFVGSQRLAEALVWFAAERQMSVAYSPANGPDVITLLDPDGRFTVADARLQAGLAAGDGRRTAVVSTLVAEPSWPALLPDGVDVIGRFTPTVAFDGSYPAVLLDVDAAPLSSGIFLLAGADAADPDPAVRLFASNGMQVQDATVYEQLTLTSALTSRYGVIVVTLAGVTAVAALLTARIHASFGRRQLVAAAVVGAPRGDLRGLVLRGLVPQVLAGTLTGAAACLVGVFVARGLMLVPTATAVLAVAVAVAVCALLWAVVLVWVAEHETRRCRRAIPC